MKISKENIQYKEIRIELDVSEVQTAIVDYIAKHKMMDVDPADVSFDTVSLNEDDPTVFNGATVLCVKRGRKVRKPASTRSAQTESITDDVVTDGDNDQHEEPADKQPRKTRIKKKKATDDEEDD